MLVIQGIISIEDQQKIENGLLQIKQEIEDGTFVWKIEDEDVHMAIENRLTELIGSAGARLHTARSRNDQVATDFTLYVQDKNIVLKNKLKQWRFSKAKDLGDIPAYMVISNNAIDDLVIRRPKNKSQLIIINGLGDKKIAQFGDELIELLNE